MNLTETPDTVQWPETHYIYLEKVGPFMQTAPAAWNEVLKFVPAISADNEITGRLSLYKVGPQIYRAGVSVAALPANVPEGLKYEKFPGGKYSRFTYTGSYLQLGPVSGRAFELAGKLGLPLRDDFNIENYLNSPHTTPEDELITEILFPVR
jgi:effector-binding domain-containing protein